MSTRSSLRTASGVLAAGIGVGVGAYAAYAAVSWYRYGRAPQPHDDQYDQLLDRFMPAYDVVERHRIRVTAPPAATLAAAREQDLFRLPLVRAIFKTREFVLRAAADDRPQPRGLLAAALALGWAVLADVADREIVVGAVTKPWEPDVTFRALPPDEFAAFAEPGFVKIAWTLRADPIDNEQAITWTRSIPGRQGRASRTRVTRFTRSFRSARPAS